MTKSEMRLAAVAGGVLGLIVIGSLANSMLIAPLRTAKERKADLETRYEKAQTLLDQRNHFVQTWREITARLPGGDPVKSGNIAAKRVYAILNSVLPFRLNVGQPSAGAYKKSNFKQIFMPVTGTLSVSQMVTLLYRLYEEDMLIQVRSFTLNQDSSRNPGQMRLNMLLASLAVPPEKYVQNYSSIKPATMPAGMIRVALDKPDQYPMPPMSAPTPTPPATPVPIVENTPGPAAPPALRIREFYDDPVKGPRAVLVEANGENARVVKFGETVGAAKLLYVHGIYGMVLVEGEKTYIVPWGMTTDAKAVLTADKYPQLVEELKSRNIVVPGL